MQPTVRYYPLNDILKTLVMFCSLLTDCNTLAFRYGMDTSNDDWQRSHVQRQDKSRERVAARALVSTLLSLWVYLSRGRQASVISAQDACYAVHAETVAPRWDAHGDHVCAVRGGEEESAVWSHERPSVEFSRAPSRACRVLDFALDLDDPAG